MTYPFSGIVGMADLRLALVLNAISPEIGGVLVRGEKGTAKSTAVRALTAVLPAVEVVSGCRFSCDPAAPDPGCPDGPHRGYDPRTRAARLVELPVGTTEDRLAGALDLERALTEGVTVFQPGLLASAHRGVLYVDEVNLLADHLVDLLLDAAALGVSYVERDGVSVRHAARFLLVGTMNPEEGELRPQLLDRFGLTVDAAAPRAVADRAEVVRRRLAFDADPATFTARFAAAEAELAARIAAARRRVPQVELPDEALERIAAVCAAFEVDGLRADLVTARTAVAHAAWEGRGAVTPEDIRVAARLALPHRGRRDPFDAPGLDEQRLEEALGDPPDPPEPPTNPPTDPHGGPPEGADGEPGAGPRGDNDGDTGGDTGGDTDGGPAGGAVPGTETAAPAEPFRPRRLEVPGIGSGAAGRRSPAETATGRVTSARHPHGRVARLHTLATLLAAAPRQATRGRSGSGLLLRPADLREAIRVGREGNLVLFLVDASGSMAARARMGAVKGAVLSLLLDAYQRRDKVGLVTFRGSGAEVALPPTSSVEAAAARLAALPTGGRTPLAAGLLRAADVLRIERLRDRHRRPLLVVVTDGRATAAPARPERAGNQPPGNGRAGSGRAGADPVGSAHRAAGLLRGVASVVVDCESGPVRLGLAAGLAAALGGVLLPLTDLRADALAGAVRALRAGPAGACRVGTGGADPTTGLGVA